MELFGRNRNNNKPVIGQVIDLIPPHLLQKAVDEAGKTVKNIDSVYVENMKCHVKNGKISTTV